MRTHLTKEALKVNSWVIELGFQTNLEQVCGKYCIDIYIPEIKWAVEVDGGIHMKGKDKKRDKDLIENYGIAKVYRVNNNVKKDEFKEKFLKELEDEMESVY